MTPGTLKYNHVPLRDALDGRTERMPELGTVAFPGIDMPSKIGFVYQVGIQICLMLI